MSKPKPQYDSALMQQVFDLGFEILQDEDTDYYYFAARNWVEDSGLCDTPEEAARACISTHGDA